MGDSGRQDKQMREPHDSIAWVTKGSKPRWRLVPWEIIEEVVVCLEEGAEKHGAYDWQQRDPDLFFDALMRHLMAWRQGQRIDPDSERGTRHLVAVAANALFLAWLDRGPENSSGISVGSAASEQKVG